jgi:hypothetical protein
MTKVTFGGGPLHPTPDDRDHRQTFTPGSQHNLSQRLGLPRN